MTLGKSLKISPVQEDNNATQEVHVKARLGNRANHFTYVRHMLGVVVESRNQLWAWRGGGGSPSHNLQEEMLVQGHHNSFEMDHYGPYA